MNSKLNNSKRLAKKERTEKQRCKTKKEERKKRNVSISNEVKERYAKKKLGG